MISNASGEGLWIFNRALVTAIWDTVFEDDPMKVNELHDGFIAALRHRKTLLQPGGFVSRGGPLD
jgi:hypothetical protein